MAQLGLKNIHMTQVADGHHEIQKIYHDEEDHLYHDRKNPRRQHREDVVGQEQEEKFLLYQKNQQQRILEMYRPPLPHRKKLLRKLHSQRHRLHLQLCRLAQWHHQNSEQQKQPLRR